jgi:hypothetical protein
VCALAVVPAGAGAATVSVSEDPESFGAELAFTAAPGEANKVRFDEASQTVTIAEEGADILPGAGCAAQDARHVVCTASEGRGGAWRLYVKLGDADDSALFARVGEYTGGTVIAEAGPGNDVLDATAVAAGGSFDGGEGRDTISGTTDGDSLAGGSGSDTLQGLGGNDTLKPDPAGAAAEDDTLDGGAGSDAVSYAERTTPVSLDLRRAAPQGSTGENDTFLSIENATGTNGDDVMLGNEKGNDFLGKAGRDRLESFDGSDRVWGEGGEPDTLRAGNGRDIVIAEGGGLGDGGAGPDTLDGTGAKLIGGSGGDVFTASGGSVSCGSGRDDVALAQTRGPLIKPGCEGLDIGRGFAMKLPLERRSSGIRARFSCDEEDGPIALCRSRLALKRGGRVLAGSRYDLSDGMPQRVDLRYRPGAKKRLGGSAKRVRVELGRYRFDTFV